VIILYLYNGFSNSTSEVILRNRSSGSVKTYLISSSNLSSVSPEASSSQTTPSSHFSSTESSAFKGAAGPGSSSNTTYKQFKSRTQIK